MEEFRHPHAVLCSVFFFIWFCFICLLTAFVRKVGVEERETQDTGNETVSFRETERQRIRESKIKTEREGGGKR